MNIEKINPSDIEKESFRIISEELGDMQIDPELEPVIKRVIHTTADFDYAKTLYFSPDCMQYARAALEGGATIVTDTQMAYSGINKRAAQKLGINVKCFMSDKDVADEAKRLGVTRARVSMDKAARLGENVIFAVGNAPTALIRLRELIDEGYRPKLIIGVPVGFVNVVASKELIEQSDVPCITARGRKGGSNVAACIVNAILYTIDKTRGGDVQDQSSSFFANKACRYFPCHKTDDEDNFNCLFCYCPLYMLGRDCGGNFTYTENGVKNCTGCTVPHSRDAAEYMKKRFPEIAVRAGYERARLDIRPCDDGEPHTWNSMITPPDEGAKDRSRAHWDSIAKPLHGLGRLESIITRIAGLTGDERVDIGRCAVVVMCADNGVTEEGVTQTDPSVTAVMAGCIRDMRSSVCLMARTVGADVFAVDMGMNTKVDGVIDMSVGNGTANMTKCAAMTDEQALQALRNGVSVAEALHRAGYKIIVTGEMGIGNTTTSSAIASVLLNMPPEKVTGRGAGLSDEGLARKCAAVRRAIEVNAPDPDDAFDVLKKVGGFDIAGLAGLYIGAAIYKIPVLIDGLPSSVAAFIAKKLVPACEKAMIATHVSAEPVSKAVLDMLGQEALIHAEMKLGEGTGAICLIPMLMQALSVYNSSASFCDVSIEQYTEQGNGK